MTAVLHLVRRGRQPLPDTVASGDARIELMPDGNAVEHTPDGPRPVPMDALVQRVFAADRVVVW